jgi:hypothetical protein
LDLGKASNRQTALIIRTQYGNLVLKVFSLISGALPEIIADSNCCDCCDTDPSFCINPEIPDVLATKNAR